MFNNEEFDMTRSSVPNSAALQASIIAMAESAPQHHDLSSNSANVVKRRVWGYRAVLPLTAFCIAALVIVVSPNKLTSPLPSHESSFVLNEALDWQEIMLLEDEWLLAEL